MTSGRSAAVLLGSGVFLLYVVGAFRAVPGLGTAANDLRIARDWAATGRLDSHPSDASHLTKPGYVALLRLLLPGLGASASENRRFLVLDALLVCAGAGLLAFALWSTIGRASAILFLLFMAAFLPLRDSCDYVASEPIGAATCMATVACVLLGRQRSPAWLAAAGALAGLLTPIRPNLGISLVAITIAIAISEARVGSARALAAGALSFAGALLLWVGLLHFAGNRSVFPRDGARTLLWGTADYYWRYDIGAWPVGADAAETARRQLRRVEDRWRDFLRPWTENRERSLEWRLLHGLFSTEELPSRWGGDVYPMIDRFVRSWWWLFAATLVALSLCALVARGRFALGGAGIAFIVVAQSLLFGADPRLALPFVPLLAALVAATLPSLRWRPWVAGLGGVVLLGLALELHRIPDMAGYDYALVRGPNRTIEEFVPSGRVPASPRRLHFRLLQEPPFSEGFVAAIDGRPALSREAGDPAPFPAFFSADLTADEAARARRSGLRLTLTTRPETSPSEFVYFPVSPPVLGLQSEVDGGEWIPSGFSGDTRGGWPVWLTSE